jgi:cytochrome c553
MRAAWSVPLVLVLVLAACGKPSEAPDTSSATPAVPSAEQARAMYQTVCATCHGEGGRGNGPAVATLQPRPRDYTDRAWQSGVTDDQIKQVILMGGAALGKSAMMPAQPELRDHPEVVAELVHLIRAFGR